MEEALERELREGVNYFERILDVLPEDRTALEFLCMACMQLGDTERFLKFSLNLAELTLKEKNVESAAELIEKLQTSDDPRAKAMVLKLQVLVAPEPELTFEKPEDRITSALPAKAAKAELDLLDKLVSEGVLTKSLVQNAYDQLENSLESGSGEFLISALYILEKENMTGAADAVAAVADAAHAPPIPLDAFELVPAQVRTLPNSLIKVRGAIPFAKLGNEWAVAVLNPLDENLKREISLEIGAKCHFFLALPSSMEKVLDRVLKEEEEEVAAATPANSAPKPIPVFNPAPRPAPAPAEVKTRVEEPQKTTVAEEDPNIPPVSDPIKSKIGIRRPQ